MNNARLNERDSRSASSHGFCPSCGTSSPGGLTCATCLPAGDDSWKDVPGAGSAATDPLEATDTTTDPAVYLEQTYEPLEASDPRYPQDHHIFPRQFEEEFGAAGIRIDEFTVTIMQAEHLRKVHPQWNEAWREFWSWFPAGHPQPTREDIEEKAAELMEAFNLLDLYIHEHGDGSGATGFVR
jgi:hypothetical protein